MKIVTIILLCLLPSALFAQPDCGKNPFNSSLVYAGLKNYNKTIFITFSNPDKGIGLGIVHPLFWDLGVYGYISAFGKYNIPGTYSHVPHQKAVIGITYYINSMENIQPRFNVGISGHSFIGNHWDFYNPGIEPYQAYLQKYAGHISCEVGMSMRVAGRITPGYVHDFIRNEGLFSLGVSFL
jgi:hypothetical protein